MNFNQIKENFIFQIIICIILAILLLRYSIIDVYNLLFDKFFNNHFNTINII